MDLADVPLSSPELILVHSYRFTFDELNYEARNSSFGSGFTVE
jgi:hypothetical protein